MGAGRHQAGRRWSLVRRKPLDLRLRAGVARTVAKTLAQRVTADPHRTLGRRTTLDADRSCSHLLRPTHRSPDTPAGPQPRGPGLSRQCAQQRRLVATTTTIVGCAVRLYHQQVITWTLIVYIVSKDCGDFLQSSFAIRV